MSKSEAPSPKRRATSLPLREQQPSYSAQKVAATNDDLLMEILCRLHNKSLPKFKSCL